MATLHEAAVLCPWLPDLAYMYAGARQTAVHYLHISCGCPPVYIQLRYLPQLLQQLAVSFPRSCSINGQLFLHAIATSLVKANQQC